MTEDELCHGTDVETLNAAVAEHTAEDYRQRARDCARKGLMHLAEYFRVRAQEVEREANDGR